MPGQEARTKSVRQKLNAMPTEFKGKNVLIVDDSIVRGTTSREIVEMARNAGANSVTFTSAAPPVRYPHVYGINMPSRAELVAAGRKIPEIAREIGSRPEVKRKKSESMSGTNHYNAKAVEVSGVKYDTIKEAAKVLEIDQRTLKKREDFKFLEKE